MSIWIWALIGYVAVPLFIAFWGLVAIFIYALLGVPLKIKKNQSSWVVWRKSIFSFILWPITLLSVTRKVMRGFREAREAREDELKKKYPFIDLPKS